MARRLFRFGSTTAATPFFGLLLLVPSVRADAVRKWESLPEHTKEWYRADARRALARQGRGTGRRE
ncbi:hypothetical protein HNR15_002587 [Allobranchiibius huperziae]|uniref:Uncharacterized protein n=1 Tax=Allobranchiibius huperziae TaxID=1874116 RepID=A0A853DKV2_9MICO|nr:hypothetical protein [Allobranchiibius huperziae]